MNEVFRFGPFRRVPADRTLRRDGGEAATHRRAFDSVALLVAGATIRLGLVLTVCSAIVLAVMSGAVHAQDRDRTIRQFHHTIWTARDGAPPEIWALDQGADGFLWLGTGSGLYRFDGMQFEPFHPASGERLASVDITAIKVLGSNEVWIGYSDGGISRLRSGHLTTYLEKDGIWPGMVVRILQGRDDTLWAASHGGLARFKDGRWQRLGTDWGIPADMVVDLFVASDGTVWVSTAGSVYFLRHGARRFEPTGLVTEHATFTQTPDGRIWIAEGLHGLRPLADYLAGERRSPWTLQAATPGNVLSVPGFAIDRQGVIWATDRRNGGIFRFDPRKVARAPRSVLPSDLTDVFRRADGLTAERSIPILRDREGNIWVGTNAGLNRFRASEIVPDTSVPATTAFGYSIAAMKDATWLTDGVWLYRALHGDIARRFERLHPASTLLLRARDGSLLYGNGGFVHRVSAGRPTRFSPPAGVRDENIRALAEDGSGTLWVAFERSGVFRLKDGTWSSKVDLGGLPTPVVAASDASGAVWFGFPGSRVSRHDATGMRVFSVPDGLDVGRIGIIAVHDGALWVGGEFGVARFDKERFRTVTSERVAPFFGISGISRTADGGFLFNGLLGLVLMNAQELAKAFSDTAYAPSYDLYDRGDGLPGVAQQGWHTPTLVSGADGRTWIISNTGVAFLDPGGRERNRLPPPVALLSATAGGVTYPTTDSLELPSGTTSLTVTYTAASLSKPEATRFRYRLEGVDADWLDVGVRREAVYNNLGPGHYRFRVIAANEDDVWNMDGAALDVDIPPTFFQSGLFKLLCAIAVAALAWLAYSMRFRAVANRIRIRMAERIEERERIARELHDTLLQSVQALTLRFQLAVNDLPAETPARPALEEAIDLAGKVIAEGRERVRDLRSLQNCAVEEIVADIARRQAFDPAVEVVVTTTGMVRVLHPLILDEVTQIASEAIFNIWRHANASRIQIDIGYGTNFSLRFADDGVGIDAGIAGKGKEGHFGLFGMRERARKLRGWLAINRLQEGGTEVLLTVPGSIAYKAAGRRGDIG
jgi:signal transduction histidine kinase/ligand-binding sensor domain-containing protein